MPRCPRLIAEVLRDIQHLAAIRPHEAPTLRLTAADWPVYCRGYYQGIVSALKVAELRVRVDGLKRQTRRKTLKAERDRAADKSA